MNLAICSSGELYGGVEEWIYTYVRYLRESRPALRTFVFLFNDGRLAARLRSLGVEPAVVSGTHKYDLALFQQAKRLLESNQIDVVHTHGYKADIVFGIVARRLRLTLIKTQHGSIESPPLLSARAFRLWVNALIARLLERNFDHVVFVTSDLMKRRRTKKENWTVIHNGIPPVIPVHGKAKFLKGGSFVVGMVGRISSVKGHRYLLEAVRSLEGRIDRLCVWIMGEGPLEDALRAYCREHNLGMVEFLGFKENVHDYLNECDILCMPSLHEGLPYALLEAMYLRIPVIASNTGGLREILRDGQDALLVEPRDPKGIAEALWRLYCNSELRAALSESAHRKVVARFMISDMAKRYLELAKEQ